MQESATTQSHHVRLCLLWCQELVSPMFTQDGTGSISGQESDQDRPSAGDDIDRERDTTSTSRRGLPEVMNIIYTTYSPTSATLITAPPTASLSLSLPPFLSFSLSDSEEPSQHFWPDSTETV